MENTTQQSRPATSRQTWALRCATGIDYRGMGLTMEEASRMLDELNRKSGYAKKEKSSGNKYIDAFNSKYDKILDEMYKKVCSTLNIESVIEEDASMMKVGKSGPKRYAFIGMGCGFAFMTYRKTPKMEEYDKHIRKVWNNRMRDDLKKMVGKAKIDYLQSIGCPIDAVLSQDMDTKSSYIWKCVEVARECGCKTADMKYWYD